MEKFSSIFPLIKGNVKNTHSYGADNVKTAMFVNRLKSLAIWINC